MKIDVKKYLLVGPMSLRDSFFREIQKLGIAEFIIHKPAFAEPPTPIQNLMEALHILRRRVPVKAASGQDHRSANVLARHIVDRNHELEYLYENERVLEKEAARIAPLGSFSLSALKELEEETKRTFQFFFAKKSQEVAAAGRPEVIYVNSAYGLDYFISINKEKTSYDGLVEIVIEKSLGELQQELAGTRREIDSVESELNTLSHYKKLLEKGLADALNQYHLSLSKERTDPLLEGALFSAEAWIPGNKIPQLIKLCDKQDIHCQPIKVEPQERPPTYLENKGAARLGEDLIHIYDTPSTADRDPSLWVFIAFGLFFSMIVADAGYGLILLGISLFLLYKYGQKPGLGRRVILLSTWLSIGCIIWGIQTTSFLGIEFPPTSPVRKVSIINWMVTKKAEYFLDKKPDAYDELVKEYPQLQGVDTPTGLLTTVKKESTGMSDYVVYGKFTDNVMIELAIFIGTIHIILSFLRYLDKNWAGFGWIVFMVGCYLYFPSVLKATSLIHYVFGVPYVAGAAVGLYLLFTGLGLAAVLAVIQRKWGGLGEIMHVIGVFADVMSYLRIYALSLAGLIMASTFDKIGTSMPLYIGIFIILAGHTVNFTLALMGGLIHGLRLNFIEWYHYSFEGGGKEFHPLALKKIDS